MFTSFNSQKAAKHCQYKRNTSSQIPLASLGIVHIKLKYCLAFIQLIYTGVKGFSILINCFTSAASGSSPAVSSPLINYFSGKLLYNHSVSLTPLLPSVCSSLTITFLSGKSSSFHLLLSGLPYHCFPFSGISKLSFKFHCCSGLTLTRSPMFPAVSSEQHHR